jgi:hypothetical protein
MRTTTSTLSITTAPLEPVGAVPGEASRQQEGTPESEQSGQPQPPKQAAADDGAVEGNGYLEKPTTSPQLDQDMPPVSTENSDDKVDTQQTPQQPPASPGPLSAPTTAHRPPPPSISPALNPEAEDFVPRRQQPRLNPSALDFVPPQLQQSFPVQHPLLISGHPQPGYYPPPDGGQPGPYQPGPYQAAHHHPVAEQGYPQHQQHVPPPPLPSQQPTQSQPAVIIGGIELDGIILQRPNLQTWVPDYHKGRA